MGKRAESYWPKAEGKNEKMRNERTLINETAYSPRRVPQGQVLAGIARPTVLNEQSMKNDRLCAQNNHAGEQQTHLMSGFVIGDTQLADR